MSIFIFCEDRDGRWEGRNVGMQGNVGEYQGMLGKIRESLGRFENLWEFLVQYDASVGRQEGRNVGNVWECWSRGNVKKIGNI